MKTDFLGRETEFDSKEEAYFAWWLNDLWAAGLIIKGVAQPEPFLLSPEGSDVSAKLDIEWTQVRPRSRKKKTKPLIRTSAKREDLIYTPDFRIEWTQEAHGIVTYINGGEYAKLPPLFANPHHSIIEVKGSRFSRAQSEEATRVRIAMAYTIYGEVTEVVRPASLFKKTFYPQRYFLTDNGNSKRSKRVNGKNVPLPLCAGVRNCAEFINEMRKKNCY